MSCHRIIIGGRLTSQGRSHCGCTAHQLSRSHCGGHLRKCWGQGRKRTRPELSSRECGMRNNNRYRDLVNPRMNQ